MENKVQAAKAARATGRKRDPRDPCGAAKTRTEQPASSGGRKNTEWVSVLFSAYTSVTS